MSDRHIGHELKIEYAERLIALLRMSALSKQIPFNGLSTYKFYGKVTNNYATECGVVGYVNNNVGNS